MSVKCYHCGSEDVIKNGRVFGWQRYKCKQCGYQFTKSAPAGKPLYLKLICHSLLMAGLSMREIARITGVTAQSVSRWIKKWHPAYMAELGEHSVVTRTSADRLAEHLNMEQTDDLLLLSTDLPSGAQYNVVIRLPRPQDKTLQK
jgi:transposase-like protein